MEASAYSCFDGFPFENMRPPLLEAFEKARSGKFARYNTFDRRLETGSLEVACFEALANRVQGRPRVDY